MNEEENKEVVEKEELEDDDSGIDVEKTSYEELVSLIEKKDRSGLLAVFETVPDADIAEASAELTPAQLLFIFRNLPRSYTATFFDELPMDCKENLIKAMTDKELIAIINEQAADDIADTIDELPANLAYRVLQATDKDTRKDVNALLKYAEDTAGSLMTTEFINLVSTTTVADAISYIRERGKDAETVYTIFVRNRQREFVGTVDLDDLIFASPEQTLNDIMNQDVVSVKTNTDQEEVGRMFQRYDLNAMAVVNEDDRLVGVITIDDAVDVIEEEREEDIARLTNMEPSEDSYMETSIWDNAKHCFPWLIGLLVLGTFVTLVLNRLEAQAIFTSLPILISFIPALMDTGGNSGGQTTGIMIRGLAVREFDAKQTAKVLWKELRSALVIATFTSIFAFIWITIEQYTGIVSLGIVGDPDGIFYDFTNYVIWNGSAFTGPLAGEFARHALTFSSLVALTMFVAITVSKAVGTLLCMGASAIKKDPALLAQPMLTTVMDVTTLLIYFAMACAFFPAFA